MKIIDLENISNYEFVDPAGMLKTVQEFPRQCLEALTLANNLHIPSAQNYDRVLICGMGGSAISGDLLKIFLKRSADVHRDYGLPSWANRQTLLLAISYSGNTEETLSSVQTALEREMQVVCLTSGGKLREVARQHQLPYIQIPTGFQPRAAFAYLTLPLFALLSRNGFMDETIEFEPVLAELKENAVSWHSQVSAPQNLAKKLAKVLFDRIPLIYGTSAASEMVARRWKTQFNENAKQHAFHSSIPELCHNELIPLLIEAPNALTSGLVLLLRDGKGRTENHKRAEILKSMLQEHAINFEEVPSQGQTQLGQLLTQIHLGDFVSVYLALLKRIDPTPVEPLARFKERMWP